MNMTAEQLGDATEFHMKKFGHYYTPGVLTPAEHLRLVEDIDAISEQSNVPKTYIYKYRVSKFCGQAEVDWIANVRQFRHKGLAGMAYVGTLKHIEDRMLVLAGAFIRNFIDARVFPVQIVLDYLKSGSMPDCSVVLVPNFFLDSGSGGHMPAWQVSVLYGWLMSRYTRGKQTVLYVSNMDKMERQYGPLFREHIESHFYQIEP